MWQTSEKKFGREKFWSAVLELVQKKYDFPPIKATTKYTDFCKNAIDFPEVEGLLKTENYLYRSNVKKLFAGIENLRGKFGLFYEYDLKNFDELREIVTEKFQTLTYFGFDKKELAELVIKNNWLGIDRLVPVGRALDMGIFWDGYDFINQMSRIICLE